MDYQEIRQLTPVNFERLVEGIFRELGYETKQILLGDDIGIDILASKGNVSIAVQVKKYSRRKINLAMVYHTFGAAAFHDCSRAIIATLSNATPRAIEVANKLGVEIWNEVDLFEKINDSNVELKPIEVKNTRITKEWFYFIWDTYIKTLQGKDISHLSRSSYISIISADDDGIIYKNSNGRTRELGIEEFHNILVKLRINGSITREEVNADYQRRGSSALCAVIASIPNVTVKNDARATTLIWNE